MLPSSPVIGRFVLFLFFFTHDLLSDELVDVPMLMVLSYQAI